MIPSSSARKHAGAEALLPGAFREAVRVRASTRRDLPWWSRRLLLAALALAVASHVLVAWWLRDLMLPPAPADAGRIEVRLIDAPLPEPQIPEPPAPPEREIEIPRPVSPPAPASVRAPPTPTPAPAAPANDAPLQLVDREGGILLPKDDGKAATPAADAFIAQSTAPSRLMGPHRPLKIRPNYFAHAWRAPQNENLLGQTLRKAYEFVDENLTAKKEFTTPWGTKIKCQAGFMFVMAMGGCGWGFPPPPGGRPTEHWKPATELDER